MVFFFLLCVIIHSTINDKNAKITEVQKFEAEECILNQETCGEIIITGFGSSDCKNKCKSHLKYLG